MKTWVCGLLLLGLMMFLPVDMAIAASKPDLENRVVIYSTHPEKMLAVIADGFTEKTGVKVDFINLKGELADRVRAEKKNPQADIMYGGPSSLYIHMAREDIFKKTVTTWGPELNPAYKDMNDRWYGVMLTPVVIFYNHQLLSAEEAPKSWADLIDPKYRDNIISRNYVSSSQRASVCGLLDYYSQVATFEDGVEYLEKLDANTKNYYGSGSLHFQAIGKKEAAISYGVLSAIIDNQVKNAMPLKIVDAEEGAIILTDAVAVIKNGPHPKAAAAFLEYAGSAEVQVLLANLFNRMPTLERVLNQCPGWMQTPVKMMPVNWENISLHELEWLNMWDTQIRNAGRDV
ncbi:MAG: extracellular solute-binding protein [Desulfobacteraceae bacterium]|nr:extracellular solute-binding protein [Desulfobacteraceae bacterium]